MRTHVGKAGRVRPCQRVRRRALVPKVGVEPTRGCPHRFLRPARLPFRHFGAAGAEGQNRTDDTTIFSRVLYQLSYLGREFYRTDGAAFLSRKGRSMLRPYGPFRG